MYSWPVLFTIAAAIAGLLGFGLATGTAAWLAKLAFLTFVAMTGGAMIARRQAVLN